MKLDGQRVLVVGLGKSGLAAARLLRSKGARVIGNDLRSRDDLGPAADELDALGIDLALGGHDESLFMSVDRIVVCPGVPPLPALDAAERAGVPIASEVELASWFVESTVIAVTGTNGKSTVTTMIGRMCESTSRPTFVGGNLGTPLTDVVGTGAAAKDGFLVVELSSFQLERVDRFRAHVALLLNVTDDHLDRYPSFGAYAAAKGRVFAGQRASDHAVVPAGDALCLGLARAGAGQIHSFGEPDGDVRVAEGVIVNGVSSLRVPLSDLRIRGKHNAANACAAALGARIAGVPADQVMSVLREFEGLPHRMQHVRDRAGVGFYDDSKATNVSAAVAAVDGLGDFGGRVVLIAGGVDKGGSWAPLAERMKRVGRAVIALGEATPIVERELSGATEVARATDIDDAVRRASRLALPGDVVLLAPACASFDMFRSYAHRGDEFQRAVRELEEVPS